MTKAERLRYQAFIRDLLALGKEHNFGPASLWAKLGHYLIEECGWSREALIAQLPASNETAPNSDNA